MMPERSRWGDIFESSRGDIRLCVIKSVIVDPKMLTIALKWFHMYERDSIYTLHSCLICTMLIPSRPGGPYPR